MPSLLLTDGTDLLLADNTSLLLAGSRPSIGWTIELDVAFDTGPAIEPGVADWTSLSTRARATNPLRVTQAAGHIGGGDEGSAEITLNNRDRVIDPTSPGAPLAPKPMRQTRLRAVVDGTTFPLFRGFIQDWPPEWSQIDSEVEAMIIDGRAWLGLQDADLDLPRQMSHERITALLDLAGWPAGLRDIADGVVEVEPYEQTSANLLRTLQDTADAEEADFYVAPDGRMTFRSRHARFDAVPAMTFGEGGIPIAAARPVPWDVSRLTTIARVELEDGRVFEWADDAAVDDFGPRVLPVRDLSLRAAEAEALAQWEVYRFSQPRLWVDALQCQGRLDGVLAQVLALQVGDAVHVLHSPPVGDDVDEVLIVERVQHSITNVSWLVGFDLSPNFGEGPWSTWDDPARGWDMNAKWAP